MVQTTRPGLSDLTILTLWSTSAAGEISVDFGEALKDACGCHRVSQGVTGCRRVLLCRKVAPDADQDIHGEMIAAGADADTAEWRTAEVELHSMQYITALQR